MFNFLKNELTRDYWLENDQEKFSERRKRVYSFMKIPRELEKFVTFGLLQCIDALLFVFTFLPIRFIKTLFKIFYYIFVKRRLSSADGTFLLNSAEICDFLKVMTLVASFVFLNYVDFSMMYHVIRGQTVIKLYIFFNMLDVADRLCSSFGQDILDSLFWTATGPRQRDHTGLFLHLALAIFYVFLHTILVLLQANTLNVAFNSHNKALLTIMISNNFLELKGSVFKRFEKSNLFQVTCSDIRERCHLTILLSIVVIRNLNQFNWDIDHFWVLLPDIMLVLVCELLVDWIKHAFITKFNEISFDVYREYSLSLACDTVSSRNARAVSDHLDVVSRRMGFIPLPLAALISRVLFQSATITTPFHAFLVFLFFTCLLSTKVLLSIFLLGYSQMLVLQERRLEIMNQQEAEFCSQVITSKDDLEIHKADETPKESFRRTKSLGQFMRKDYDVVMDYESSSEEQLEEQTNKKATSVEVEKLNDDDDEVTGERNNKKDTMATGERYLESFERDVREDNEVSGDGGSDYDVLDSKQKAPVKEAVDELNDVFGSDATVDGTKECIHNGNNNNNSNNKFSSSNTTISPTTTNTTTTTTTTTTTNNNNNNNKVTFVINRESGEKLSKAIDDVNESISYGGTKWS